MAMPQGHPSSQGLPGWQGSEVGTPRLFPIQTQHRVHFLAVVEVLAGVLPTGCQATAFSMVRGRDLWEKKVHSMGGWDLCTGLGEKHMRASFLVHLPSGLAENIFLTSLAVHLAALVWEKTHAEARTICMDLMQITKAEFQELVKCGFFSKRLM